MITGHGKLPALFANVAGFDEEERGSVERGALGGDGEAVRVDPHTKLDLRFVYEAADLVREGALDGKRCRVARRSDSGSAAVGNATIALHRSSDVITPQDVATDCGTTLGWRLVDVRVGYLGLAELTVVFVLGLGGTSAGLAPYLW